jgi:omega-amidase
MRIALAQIDITWENKEDNKKKALNFIEKAKEQKVDFVLFPEMSLTGFSMNVPLIGEKQDDASSTKAWFADKALKNNIYIGFGYVEIHPETMKGINKFSVASPDGNIISDYSKIHPFSFGLEAEHYVGGHSITIFKLQDFTAATFICYDLRFPEIFQYASKEASLITISANWPKARREHWITLLKARAIENQCYIAGINRVGWGDNIEYCGDSMIINPLGNIITQRTNEESLIVADIDSNEVREIRESFQLKRDRREDFYSGLYRVTL